MGLPCRLVLGLEDGRGGGGMITPQPSPYIYYEEKKEREGVKKKKIFISAKVFLESFVFQGLLKAPP